MNIIFNEKPGEIYDIFLSLWLANNYEYANEGKNKYNMKDTKFEEKIYSLLVEKENSIINNECYFSEVEPFKLFSLETFWNNPTLEQFFKYLKNVDEFKIRRKIIELLLEGESDKDIIEKLASDKDSVLKFIKEKKISHSLKWHIYCLLDNREQYVIDFKKFINEYMTIYKTLEKERKKDIDKFNKKIENNINKHGVNYIKKLTNNYIDFDKYENIYISSSALIGIASFMKLEEKSCYVFVGPRIENILKNVIGKNDLDKNLSVLKNISDGTRYKIIKNLINKDYCGTELAEKLEITNATVSHHMSFLRLAGIVSEERKDRKIYYCLNKDTLRKTIQFFNEDFKL